MSKEGAVPSTGLRGPYPLTTDGVTKSVTSTLPGAYALGFSDEKETFHVQYVGRSDDDVKARLLKHVPEPYRQFKFEYYASAKAAFEKECELYHDFPNDNNKLHPARPEGSYWKCPRCTTFD